MNVLWGMTGAGHLLAESADAALKAAKKHKITVAFSGAGYEVARMYGLLKKIEDCAQETIKEEAQGWSHPLVGRVALREYDAVIISPCTANSAAKIVAGIADSLITNIVAQAVKSKTRVYVVPTDAQKTQETALPLVIDQSTCRNCRNCRPKNACPEKAIYRDEKMRVNMLICNACRKCLAACPYGAISFGKSGTIHLREIDLKNTRQLSKMEGITVLPHPDEIKLTY
jgi:dihydromethanopterin reductase (acceptor)